MTDTTNTDPMPCGNTCGTCPLSSLCHSDDVDVDPAEVAAYLLAEREAVERDRQRRARQRTEALDRAHNIGGRASA